MTVYQHPAHGARRIYKRRVAMLLLVMVVAVALTMLIAP